MPDQKATEVFRVEQLEYDYSPTAGIFSSLELAETYIKAAYPKVEKDDQDIWTEPNRHDYHSPQLVVFRSILNDPSIEEECV